MLKNDLIGKIRLKAHCQVRDNFWQRTPLKMIKNTFYFTLKALFVLKTLNFGQVKNCLIQKVSLIPSLMTSQPGKKVIAIQISQEVNAISP